MKPIVDHDLCIGCGVCQEICPEVFEVQNDKAEVIGPDRCATCQCEEAMASCPVGAISIGQ